MYAVNSDGKTPFDVINADVDGGENVTDVLLRFGFNPRANAAAKAQVRAPLSLWCYMPGPHSQSHILNPPHASRCGFLHLSCRGDETGCSPVRI